MQYQALIHYKNDEETVCPVREDFWEALSDLSGIIKELLNSEDSFNPEDVQFVQVQSVEN